MPKGICWAKATLNGKKKTNQAHSLFEGINQSVTQSIEKNFKLRYDLLKAI